MKSVDSLAIRPDGSIYALTENLAGQLYNLASYMAPAFGQSIATLLGAAPSNVDLKAFGDYVTSLSQPGAIGTPKAATTSTAGSISQEFSAVEQDLGTLTWDGTPPAGTVVKKYIWRKVGKIVTMWYRGTFSSAGTTNSILTFALPADMPTPFVFTGWDNSELGYLGVGGIGASEASTFPNPQTTHLEKDGSGGFLVRLRGSSTNATVIWGSISYPIA